METRRIINIWEERFEDIRNFEEYLARNGIVIRKFFLHISKKLAPRSVVVLEST